MGNKISVLFTYGSTEEEELFHALWPSTAVACAWSLVWFIIPPGALPYRLVRVVDWAALLNVVLAVARLLFPFRKLILRSLMRNKTFKFIWKSIDHAFRLLETKAGIFWTVFFKVLSGRTLREAIDDQREEFRQSQRQAMFANELVLQQVMRNHRKTKAMRAAAPAWAFLRDAQEHSNQPELLLRETFEQRFLDHGAFPGDKGFDIFATSGQRRALRLTKPQ